ncbi:MAG TPA: hypothetical protein VK843_03125 [Planctomycetota bacterium]|nr:hypothetical protein [Planctomycetota bacterium]
MGDIRVDNYKTAVKAAMDRWKAKLATIGAKAKTARAELKKLRASGVPTVADQKRINELVAELEQRSADVDKATLELKLDLMGLDSKIKDAPKKELQLLPDWMKTIIKEKGIPLGDGVVITPEVKFDFDKFKLTYIGIKLKW